MKVSGRSRVIATTLFLGLVLTAAGCAPTVTTQSNPPPAPQTVGQPNTLQIKRGGIIRTPMTHGVHLDPSIATPTPPLLAVYERLVEYRAESYNDTEVVPNIAESWSVSPDGLTITLKLHKGVRWHDVPPVNGREFTSEDVKWNAWYYTNHSAYKFLWQDVATVETPDPYTAVLRMKSPNAVFIPYLAHPNNNMLAREIYEAQGHFKTIGVGTGPFVVSQFEPNQKLILKKNPNYWRKSLVDGQPLPYLDGIEGHVVLDTAARLAAYRAKQYEIPYQLESLKPDEVVEFKKLGYEVLEGVAGFSRALLINSKDPLWQDKRVRQAASLALDRQAFIDVLYDGFGTYQDFIPIPEWGWDQATIRRKFPRDVNRARQLLTEAGKLNAKLTISGYVSGVPGLGARSVQLVADNLKEAGFDISINMVPDFATMTNNVLKSGKWQAHVHHHGRFGLDPDNYLSASTLSTLAHNVNLGAVKDPKLDEMIMAQLRESDAAKRKVIINQIQDYMYEELPLIPIAQPKLFYPKLPVVKGPNYWHVSLGFVGAADIWLDK